MLTLCTASLTRTATDVTANSVFVSNAEPRFSDCIADLVDEQLLFTYVYAPRYDTA